MAEQTVSPAGKCSRVIERRFSQLTGSQMGKYGGSVSTLPATSRVAASHVQGGCSARDAGVLVLVPDDHRLQGRERNSPEQVLWAICWTLSCSNSGPGLRQGWELPVGWAGLHGNPCTNRAGMVAAAQS